MKKRLPKGTRKKGQMFTQQVNKYTLIVKGFTFKVIYFTNEVNFITSKLVSLFLKVVENFKINYENESERSLYKKQIAPGTSNSNRAILIRVVETTLESKTKLQNSNVSTITFNLLKNEGCLEMAYSQ